MSHQKKLIIISSLLSEAITESLSKMTTDKHHIILLVDFLNSVSIFDEISIDQTKIDWEKDNAHINNDDNTLILSRLFYTPLDIFNDFEIEDKNYALTEINAYLGFALNSFHLLNYAVDENGHEILHPLPTQWELIKNKNQEYLTPEYYWGDYRFNHLQNKNLIYSNIYNFKKWRPSKIPDDKMIFCFKKPSGNPYFSLVINGSALITVQSLESNLSIINDIATQSIILSKQFNYFISESLYFYDGEKITIAFISPLVLYSKKNNQFDTFVHNNIIKALQS